MAAVSVFVDDAVRGRLPGLCVKTGDPADLVVRTSPPVGGGMSGAAWLLVLLGPPGWFALVVLLALSSGTESLTVRLPYTQVAWDRERRLRRTRLAMAVLGVAALVVALLHPGPFPLLWLVLGGGLLVGAFVLWSRAYFADIGISLDASRRWVTITGVHPAFARAVQLQEEVTGNRI